MVLLAVFFCKTFPVWGVRSSPPPSLRCAADRTSSRYLHTGLDSSRGLVGRVCVAAHDTHGGVLSSGPACGCGVYGGGHARGLALFLHQLQWYAGHHFVRLEVVAPSRSVAETNLFGAHPPSADDTPGHSFEASCVHVSSDLRFVFVPFKCAPFDGQGQQISRFASSTTGSVGLSSRSPISA